MKTNYVYLGIGWLVDNDTHEKLLNYTENTDRANEIADNFYEYNANGKWFFGEILYEIPEGEAKTLMTLISIQSLFNFEEFSLNYGMMLVDCGLSVEEINESWSNPDLFIIHGAYA